MSLKIYCSKCAEATEYTLSKPKFCSHCAASFNESISSKPIEKTNSKPFVQIPARTIEEDGSIIRNGKRFLRDEDGEYEEITEIPQIDKLDVNIDLRGSDNRRMTLGNLRPDLAERMSKPQAKRGRKKK